MRRAPKALSIELVIEIAVPSRSTIDRWLVDGSSGLASAAQQGSSAPARTGSAPPEPTMHCAASGRGDKRPERFEEQQIRRQALDFRATSA